MVRNENFCDNVVLAEITHLLTVNVFLLWTAQKHAFTFDKVFAPTASQEDVFAEISQLVQSALDGYKVTNIWKWQIILCSLFVGLIKADIILFSGVHFCIWTNWVGKNLYNDG